MMWKNHSLVLIVALILAACGTGTSQAPDRPFERARGPGGEQLAMTGETRPESSPEAEGFSDETASDGRLSLDSSEETAEYGGDMPMEEPQLMPSPAPMRSSASGTAMGRGALEMPAGGEGEAASDEARASSAPPRAQSWRQARAGESFASVRLGGGHSLELKRMRVSVQVEGMRARTVVDHIFHNPHGRTVEGTFRYTLPPGASVSSYAMFLGSGQRDVPQFFGPDVGLDPEQLRKARVEQIIEQVDPQAWGELRVGRLVRSVQGRRVYEEVTRRRIDPALVEQVAPNTFEARVFPIRANGFNRVILSYEQTLPHVGAELEYEFPIAEGPIESFELELGASKGLAPRARYTGSIEGIREQSSREEHVFGLRLAGRSPGGSASFRLRAAGSQGIEVLAGTNPVRGEKHFLLRLEADATVGGGPIAGAEQAVFLLDTSLSAHPDRFGIDVALLREILSRNASIRRFNVITFDAGARWLGQGWIPNDEAGRGRALARLDDLLLEGATDFSAALEALATPPMATRGALDVFVLSDGAITWGSADIPSLLARFRSSAAFEARFFGYRTGLGAENLSLLQQLTRQGGAVFDCLTTESVPTCATAHGREGMRVERVEIVGRGQRGARVRDILVAGRQATLVPGSSFLLAGELQEEGDATLRVHGTRGGRSQVIERPITLRSQGELASRAWAEMAIAQLLASRDEDLEGLALALSQHYRVPNRLASYLVLETDAEYEQYDLLAARRGHEGAEVGALVTALEAQGGSVRTAFSRIDRALREGAQQNRLLALDGGEVFRSLRRWIGRQHELLGQNTAVPLLHQQDAPEAYRQGLSHDPSALGSFRAEAQRRKDADQLGAAIRALSSIVENDPSSAEAARVVAYRLGAWGANGHAAELLLRVLERRPYEPQPYRDLANLLWLRRPAITALLFEAALSGQWDGRFLQVQTVVREEYALFIRAHRREHGDHPFAQYLASREQALNLRLEPADLRVTMTWNTDNTDIDLWVTDPRGEKCYYAHRNIASGGELLDDVTRGFGPERFHAIQSVPGEYLVQAHYYGNNGNRLLAETDVTLTVATHVGTDRERVERHVVTLRDSGDIATVARIQM